MTPEELKQQITEAGVAFQQGDRAKTVLLCEEVLATLPDEPNALQLLGLVRVQEGNLPLAIDLLERARKSQHKNIHLLNNLGTSYRRAGRLNDARTTLNSAVALDPRFAPAQYNLGNVLRDLDDVAGARRAFEAAVQSKPNYADAHAALASLAEVNHDLALARKSAAIALAIDPNHAVAHLALARVDLREDHPSDAAARLQAVIAPPNVTGTNRVIAHGLLGQALDRLGNYAQAFASFASGNALQRQRHAGTLQPQLRSCRRKPSTA